MFTAAEIKDYINGNPFINKSALSREAGISNSNLSEALSGKKTFGKHLAFNCLAALAMQGCIINGKKCTANQHGMVFISTTNNEPPIIKEVKEEGTGAIYYEYHIVEYRSVGSDAYSVISGL